MLHHTAVVLLTLALTSAAQAMDGLVVTDGSSKRPLSDVVETVEQPIIHLWATWCAPCREELPVLADALDDVPELRETLFVVSVDTRPFQDVRAFLAETLNLPALRTLQVVEGNAGAAFDVRGYPSTMVLDGDGTVIRRITGPVDWADGSVRADLLAN